MIRIAHILKDEKFTDGVYSTFQSDKRLINLPVFFSNKSNYKFQKIKKIKAIKVICKSKDFIDFLSGDNYDVIYFHSLPILFWDYIKFIPKDKTVIWWLYGYEVYESFFRMDPILNIDLYKPITKSHYRKDLIKQALNLAYFCKNQLIKTMFCDTIKIRDEMLQRIDYLQPIFSNEVDLLKESHSIFHASEFYNKDSLYFNLPVIKTKNINGAILFGNSSSFTNNHIDVWRSISPHIKSNRVIVPLSYGDMRYRSIVKHNIESDRVMFLDSFMDKEDYFNLLDQCSYMVIGVMRQQASENIYYCISRGMKVFFYKDSIPYIYLKSKGYIVYAIEDVDDNSFSTPLTINEIMHNQNMLKKEKQYCDKIYEDVMNKLISKYNHD